MVVQKTLSLGQNSFTEIDDYRQRNKNKGRQCFSCPHGIKRKGTGTNQRPCQRVKYTGCQVRVTVNEQHEGCWAVMTCFLEHEGHALTKQLYFSRQRAKKLTDEDKEFVKGLMRARANNRNIASCLSYRT